VSFFLLLKCEHKNWYAYSKHLIFLSVCCNKTGKDVMRNAVHPVMFLFYIFARSNLIPGSDLTLYSYSPGLHKVSLYGLT